MKVLGIDPGSITTGYGLLESRGNRLKLIAAGPLRLKKQHNDMAKRLEYLGCELEKILLTYKPDALAVEKVFHSVNFSSALKLGYVRGVVLFLAARFGLEIAEYSPTEVKKSLTGYGRAEKGQVQEMVRMLLGLEKPPQPHDVADALALAIYHAHTAPILKRMHQRP